MPIATADLCDTHQEEVSVCHVQFRDLGGRLAFHGRCATLTTWEDHRPVGAALQEPGDGRVLIVDGGGSLDAALLGDWLGGLALANGWAGIVVNGAVRDCAALALLDLGVKAMGSCPRRGGAGAHATRGQTVQIGGCQFHEGDWVYADGDGLIVARTSLQA